MVDVLPPEAAEDEALVAALARIVNGAYAVGEAGLWRDGMERTSQDEIAATIRAGGLLAATLDGRLAGCATVRPLEPGAADLGMISTAPDQWGRGVGHALIEAAETLMRSRGVTTMQLELLVPEAGTHPEKERLRAWYTRHGYAVVRTAPFEEIAAASLAASQLATPCVFLVFRKAL